MNAAVNSANIVFGEVDDTWLYHEALATVDHCAEGVPSSWIASSAGTRKYVAFS